MDHPIAEQNRYAKGERLANAILVIHRALRKNRLVPESPAEYASAFPQAVWNAIGRAIGEPRDPNTSIEVALSLLEKEEDSEAVA